MVNEYGKEMNGQEKMCRGFQKHFVVLFRRSGTLYHGDTLRDFLASGPCLSVYEAERYEGKITAAEVIRYTIERIGHW